MMNEAGNGSAIGSLFRSAEHIAGIGAALAALGYASLISHLAQLGASLTTGIGLEIYLRETYSFLFDVATVVLSTLFSLASNIPVLLGLAVAGGGFFFLGRRARQKLSPRVIQHLPVAIGAAVCTLQLLLVWDLFSSPHPALATGALSPNADRARTGLYFGICVWACLAGWAIIGFSRAPEMQQGPRRWTMDPRVLRGVRLLTIGFTFFLPVAHGLTWRDASYHVASVRVDKVDQPRCGLMVMTTGAEVILWRAQKGQGGFLSIPLSQVITVATEKERDIYEVIREAAANKNATQFPACPNGD